MKFPFYSTGIFVLAAITLTGCATVKRGLWTYQSGAEPADTEREGDTAIVTTRWGSVRIYPQLINNIGLGVEIEITNESGTAIEFSLKQVQLQNVNGEVQDAYPLEMVLSALSGNVAISSMIVGGNYATQTAASLYVQNEHRKKLLLDGPVPSHSSRKGIVYFDAERAMGDIRVRLAKTLTGQERIVQFTVPVKRSVASSKPKWNL